VRGFGPAPAVVIKQAVLTMNRPLFGAVLAAALLAGAVNPIGAVSLAEVDGTGLIQVYGREVDRRLTLPLEEVIVYVHLLHGALGAAGIVDTASQFFLVVDRHPQVQVAMILWRDPGGGYYLIGASPVSTGKPGRYEHFLTPLGVFDNSVANFDFRAEGTINENGIRGFGVEGMRIYDFGWQEANRGWGRGGRSPMRLLMHSTDPDLLEPRIGSPQSKGCIRIPAALNEFLDRYGILDADYFQAAEAAGGTLWVLRPDREPTLWPGRYLIVVESHREARPQWAVQSCQGRDRGLRAGTCRPPGDSGNAESGDWHQ
jgi:hypothetical protein